MVLAAGDRLGPYEVVSAIGAGGMGEVYRASDSRLERAVAVKVLPPGYAHNPDRLRRFELEARAVAALNHPNILGVYDIGEYEGSPYIVCELLEGETLRAKMQQGAMPQRRAVEYASQIAAGLAAAHAKGVVHRDLKPENVFVTRDGQVKVLDFGLAKLARAEAAVADGATADGSSRTAPGMVLGTAGYMSPEQVRGREVDARTDIFAFGAILYEMVSGQRAFRGESPAETMSAILKEDPPDLETEKLRVSPGLERIVRRCLEKEPERRFESARDVAFSLEAISGSSASSGQQRRIPSPRRRGAWQLLIVAGAVALAVLAGFYIGRARTSAPRDTSFQLLTFKPQIVFRALFAPDGKSVVFASARSGTSPDVFTVNPDYPEPRATSIHNAQLLAVSSKGELLVLRNLHYASHRLYSGTLARVPMEGSAAPRDILDDVFEADWTPDGSDIAVTRIVEGKFRLEYPMGRVLAETTGYLSDVRFSPAGDKIAFFEHPLRFDDRGTVDVVDLAGHKRVLTGAFWGEEGLAWSRDGREIWFSAGSDYQSFPVRAVNLEGHSRVVLASAGGLMLQDLNRAGQLLVTREDQRRDMLGAAPGAKSETDLTFLDNSQPGAISADGTTLLFTEDNGIFGGNYAVFVRALDGSPAIRLGEGDGQDISADGKLALAVILTSPDKLVAYPTGAGQSWQMNLGSIRNVDTAQWFPDSRKVLVCGSEAGHGARCYAVTQGGNPVAVTPEGSAAGCNVARHLCLVSPDGSEVIARDARGRYSAYPLSGGAPRQFAFLTPQDGILRWTRDGHELIVRGTDWEAAVNVQRVDVRTGRRTLVRRLAPAEAGTLAIQGIAAGADGQSYAYAVKRQRSWLFLAGAGK